LIGSRILEICLVYWHSLCSNELKNENTTGEGSKARPKLPEKAEGQFLYRQGWAGREEIGRTSFFSDAGLTVHKYKTRETSMYALIYDDQRPERVAKKVISVHKSREGAEFVLERRMARLGRKDEECCARVVWTEKAIKIGDEITPEDYETCR
jgi:hypothetical protein